MSINSLSLEGWDDTSTWGVDQGMYYAQLTPNGVSDADGPRIWIAPPVQVILDTVALARAIADATGVPAAVVDEAMNRGHAASGSNTNG